ncbi:MAG: hypothetical protein A2075_11025 [Geobacteraceae bacterium GWC2_58_44]|nr:MAG: hypothetical protein A2075_11025 [Geobacteraceae bacterium GWC2_58_44]
MLDNELDWTARPSPAAAPLNAVALGADRFILAGSGGTLLQSDILPSTCSLALDANEISVGSAAATGSIQVQAPTGCSWTASSDSAWLTVSAGAAGSGRGTVSYAVAANGGAARTGTISAGGELFTVQQAPLEYTITTSVSGSGGSLACASPVVAGSDALCTISVAAGASLVRLKDNNIDVTAAVAAGRYTLRAVRANHGIAASFSDPTPPVVTAFSVPGSSTALAVSVSLSATDNDSVTGYLLTETPVPPLAASPGWSATAPAGYTFAFWGTRTLYAWARDAGGNVSAPATARVALTPVGSAALDSWHWRSPLPQANNLTAVTWGNGLFVAVGWYSAIVTSADGSAWSVSAAPELAGLLGVAYGNGVYVAVGNTGTIFSSFDGATWSKQNSGKTANLAAVTFGNGLFVAVGDSGVIVTSADGVNWSSRYSGAVYGFKDVVRGNALFVAAGAGGVLSTSPDGVTWTPRSREPP